MFYLPEAHHSTTYNPLVSVSLSGIILQTAKKQIINNKTEALWQLSSTGVIT